MSISTTFVPLHEPYQIIKYGREIGMQIGTLIATKQINASDESSFQIETHSYPVVTYSSKSHVPEDVQLFDEVFMEGVVWNKVELKNISTICLSNSILSWDEFINFMWEDMRRYEYKAGPQVSAYHNLSKLGVEIDCLPSGTFTINLITDSEDGETYFVRSTRDDILALNIPLNQDIDSMSTDLSFQVFQYKTVLLQSGQYDSKDKLVIKYASKEDMLKPLVDILNNKNKRNLFGSFSVKAITTYDDEKAHD